MTTNDKEQRTADATPVDRATARKLLFAVGELIEAWDAGEDPLHVLAQIDGVLRRESPRTTSINEEWLAKVAAATTGMDDLPHPGGSSARATCTHEPKREWHDGERSCLDCREGAAPNAGAEPFTPEFFAAQVTAARSTGEPHLIDEAETIAFLNAHGVPVRWGRDTDTASGLVRLLERTRADAIEACAELADREARICSGQKNAAKGSAKSIHVGGECIALSLAAQIRDLATDSVSAEGSRR